MASQSNVTRPGLSNLAYNLVTILENKAKAAHAYETYKEDARQEGSPDCVALIERIHQDDLRHIDELKQYVASVLAGGKLGAQNNPGESGQSGSQLRR